jgi:hypothetical protein
VHVAFTPDQVPEARVAVVVDVLRATSTIAQALASGYERVYCCREIEDALALREKLGEGLLGGERQAVRIEGFDIGASPLEVLLPQGEVLIYSTTNGTAAVLAAAERCDEVMLGSLLNLSAVSAAIWEDCVIVCAGFQGQFALGRPDRGSARCRGDGCGQGVGDPGAFLSDAAGRPAGANLRPARPREGHRVLRPGEHDQCHTALHPVGGRGG